MNIRTILAWVGLSVTTVALGANPPAPRPAARAMSMQGPRLQFRIGAAPKSEFQSGSHTYKIDSNQAGVKLVRSMPPKSYEPVIRNRSVNAFYKERLATDAPAQTKLDKLNVGPFRHEFVWWAWHHWGMYDRGWWAWNNYAYFDAALWQEWMNDLEFKQMIAQFDAAHKTRQPGLIPDAYATQSAEAIYNDNYIDAVYNPTPTPPSIVVDSSASVQLSNLLEGTNRVFGKKTLTIGTLNDRIRRYEFISLPAEFDPTYRIEVKRDGDLYVFGPSITPKSETFGQDAGNWVPVSNLIGGPGIQVVYQRQVTAGQEIHLHGVEWSIASEQIELFSPATSEALSASRHVLRDLEQMITNKSEFVQANQSLGDYVQEARDVAGKLITANNNVNDDAVADCHYELNHLQTKSEAALAQTNDPRLASAGKVFVDKIRSLVESLNEVDELRDPALPATDSGLVFSGLQNAASPVADVSLFDGKDLAGWNVDGGNADHFYVDSGELVAAGTTSKTRSYLLSERDYTNFVLRLEYKTEAGAGGGIAIRAEPGETLPETKTEGRDHPLLKICGAGNPEITGATHWLRDFSEVPANDVVNDGIWNKLVVEVQGNSLKATINGKQICSITSIPGLLLSDGKVPGLNRATGRIGIEQHTNTIRYRNIEIQELTAALHGGGANAGSAASGFDGEKGPHSSGEMSPPLPKTNADKQGQAAADAAATPGGAKGGDGVWMNLLDEDHVGDWHILIPRSSPLKAGADGSVSLYRLGYAWGTPVADAAIRATVQQSDGIVFGLYLRGVYSSDASQPDFFARQNYSAAFDGTSFSIGVRIGAEPNMILARTPSKIVRGTSFVMQFSAIGDQLALTVDGNEILRVTDKRIDKGVPAIGAWKGSWILKDIQLQLPGHPQGDAKANVVALDPLQSGTIWKDDAHHMKLTILQRTGDNVHARWEDGSKITRDVTGVMKNGTFSWLAANVQAIKGGPGGDNTGILNGNRLDFTYHDDHGHSGSFALTLDKAP